MYKKEERKVEWVAASERERIPMKEKRSDFAPRKLGSSGGREGGLRETFVPLEGRATFYLCIN